MNDSPTSPIGRDQAEQLAALRDLVDKIQIRNPSGDVREVLEITKLNQLFEVGSEVVP